MGSVGGFDLNYMPLTQLEGKRFQGPVKENGTGFLLHGNDPEINQREEPGFGKGLFCCPRVVDGGLERNRWLGK